MWNFCRGVAGGRRNNGGAEDGGSEGGLCALRTPRARSSGAGKPGPSNQANNPELTRDRRRNERGVRRQRRVHPSAPAQSPWPNKLRNIGSRRSLALGSLQPSLVRNTNRTGISSPDAPNPLQLENCFGMRAFFPFFLYSMVHRPNRLVTMRLESAMAGCEVGARACSMGAGRARSSLWSPVGMLSGWVRGNRAE